MNLLAPTPTPTPTRKRRERSVHSPPGPTHQLLQPDYTPLQTSLHSSRHSNTPQALQSLRSGTLPFVQGPFVHFGSEKIGERGRRAAREEEEEQLGERGGGDCGIWREERRGKSERSARGRREEKRERGRAEGAPPWDFESSPRRVNQALLMRRLSSQRVRACCSVMKACCIWARRRVAD